MELCFFVAIPATSRSSAQGKHQEELKKNVVYGVGADAQHTGNNVENICTDNSVYMLMLSFAKLSF